MTLKEIRAMFQVGQTWNAVNTRWENACGPRVVEEVMSARIVWTRGGGKRSYMDLPKASMVVEARSGFLKFKLFDEKDLNPAQDRAMLDHTVELQLQQGA